MAVVAGGRPRRLAPIALPPGRGAGDRRHGSRRARSSKAGELLGALAIRKPASDPVTPAGREADRATSAAQAGLVLRNVRLTEELEAAARRAEGGAAAPGVRAGRGPPAARAQHPRRRAAAARGARGEAAGWPTGWSNATPRKAHELLGAAPGRDARRARGPAGPGPRDLPAAARRQGLCPRRSRRRPARAGCPSTVERDGVGRYPQAVEAAVYFSLPRGAAERREVRPGVQRRRRGWPNATAHPVHRERRRHRVRSERSTTTARASRGSPTGWARSTDGSR